MKQHLACSLALVLMSAQTLPGQEPAAAPVAAPPQAEAVAAKPEEPGKYKLSEGTEVSLQFAQDLSSATAMEGDPVLLTLTEDVRVGGVVVAKAGAKAFGEVTKAQKSGRLGKAGQLNMRFDYLKVGDARVKLRGAKGREGDKMTDAGESGALFGSIGLIRHGKNVEIKQGQALKAYVGEDVALGPVS